MMFSVLNKKTNIFVNRFNTCADSASNKKVIYVKKELKFIRVGKKNIKKFMFILSVGGDKKYENGQLFKINDYKVLRVKYALQLGEKLVFKDKKSSYKLKFLAIKNFFIFGFLKGTKKKRLSFSKQKIASKWSNTVFTKKILYKSSINLKLNYSWSPFKSSTLQYLLFTKVTSKKEWVSLKNFSKTIVSGKSLKFQYSSKNKHLSKSNWIFEPVPLFFLEQSKGSSSFGHPFHLVNPSILPLTISLGFFCFLQNIIGFIWFTEWHSVFLLGVHSFLVVNMFSIVLTWVLEIFAEEQSGAHTLEVQKGFQYAILLFILSELMLFVSFFWAYFHFSLNSNSFTGGTFIPKGLIAFYWYRIPLLNTLLLLSSGLSLTVAHILLIEWDKYLKVVLWLKLLSFHTFELIAGSLWSNKQQWIGSRSVWSLFQRKSSLVDFRGAWNSMYGIVRSSNEKAFILPISYSLNYKNIPTDSLWLPNFWVLDTVIKGFVFMVYQAYEYSSSMFSINDSVYGAVFFSLTGLHGLHVLIGVTFLFTYLVIHFRQTFSRYFIKSGKIFTYTDRGVVARTSYSFNFWTHRIAFDGAAWYWHFVDVVWFFVFLFVYWWGFSDIAL